MNNLALWLIFIVLFFLGTSLEQRLDRIAAAIERLDRAEERHDRADTHRRPLEDLSPR